MTVIGGWYNEMLVAGCDVAMIKNGGRCCWSLDWMMVEISNVTCQKSLSTPFVFQPLATCTYDHHSLQCNQHPNTKSHHLHLICICTGRTQAPSGSCIPSVQPVPACLPALWLWVSCLCFLWLWLQFYQSYLQGQGPPFKALHIFHYLTRVIQWL